MNRNIRRLKKRKNIKKKGLTKRAKFELNRLAVELKFIDHNTATIVDTGAPFIFYVSSIAQGSDLTNRVGRQIKPMYYTFNATLTKAAAPTYTFFRMVLFQDTQNIGVAPNIAQIMAVNQTNSAYDILISKGRFRVLYDKLINMDNASNYSRCWRKTVKVPLPIMFTGTTNGVASAGKNSLWLLLMSDQTLASSPFINLYHRLRYTDS